MRVRFQADADLDGRILRGLRRAAPEIDIRTASDAKLAGLSDPEVLRVAAGAGRILVSQDRDAETFRSLRERHAQSRNHSTSRSDPNWDCD
jgi:predicted nuclease of predicted toxin-antitoxin system